VSYRNIGFLTLGTVVQAAIAGELIRFVAQLAIMLLFRAAGRLCDDQHLSLQL
jgi:hypothetical protein